MTGNRTALITGGNRGIGFATARLMLENGYNVIITSRSSNKGTAAVDQLRTYSPNIDYLEADVSDLNSISKLKYEILERFGTLDILINNAGVYLDEDQVLLQINPQVFETTIKTNLFGPFYLCQAFLPVMATNGYGRVVNISSSMGTQASLNSTKTASYRLSKNALNGLTRLLAATVTNPGVKINAVDPGWVQTDMGGPSAPRSPEKAAEGIFWLATLPADGPTGGFFLDKNPVSW